MKYNNRNDIFLKKGWFVQLETQSFQIIHVEWTHFTADLLQLANPVVANLANGGVVGPITIPELQSKYYNVLVHGLMAPKPEQISRLAVEGDLGAGTPTVIVPQSAEIRYFMPSAQPRLFVPDYESTGFIDETVSQLDDPSEWTPFFLTHNDEPAFEATNNTGVTLDEVVLHFYIAQYVLNRIGPNRPTHVTHVTPVPYSKTLIADFKDKAKISAL